MNKTNLQHLIDALEKATTENIIIYKETGINKDGYDRYIAINDKRAYIINCDKNGHIEDCSCQHYTYRDKKVGIICKHQIATSIEFGLNIARLNSNSTIISTTNDDCIGYEKETSYRVIDLNRSSIHNRTMYWNRYKDGYTDNVAKACELTWEEAKEIESKDVEKKIVIEPIGNIHR